MAASKFHPWMCLFEYRRAALSVEWGSHHSMSLLCSLKQSVTQRIVPFRLAVLITEQKRLFPSKRMHFIEWGWICRSVFIVRPCRKKIHKDCTLKLWKCEIMSLVTQKTVHNTLQVMYFTALDTFVMFLCPLKAKQYIGVLISVSQALSWQQSLETILFFIPKFQIVTFLCPLFPAKVQISHQNLISVKYMPVIRFLVLHLRPCRLSARVREQRKISQIDSLWFTAAAVNLTALRGEVIIRKWRKRYCTFAAPALDCYGWPLKHPGLAVQHWAQTFLPDVTSEG